MLRDIIGKGDEYIIVSIILNGVASTEKEKNRLIRIYTSGLWLVYNYDTGIRKCMQI